MSQTSIERLRDYLGQLPPQSQALLMREFERAIARGEDTAVATLVLEQLRKLVRSDGEDTRARSGDLARLLFRPLEPFLVEGNAPARPGQVRRASLAQVWQWLAREGAPEQVKVCETVLASSGGNENARELDAAIRKLQAAAADAILKLSAPGQGDDKQRALARVGPPDVIEDLSSIGAGLKGREALDGLGGRLPTQIRTFGDPQVMSVGEALNVPSLQTPQLLPFAVSLVMQRLAAPWQIIRLATKLAG